MTLDCGEKEIIRVWGEECCEDDSGRFAADNCLEPLDGTTSHGPTAFPFRNSSSVGFKACPKPFDSIGLAPSPLSIPADNSEFEGCPTNDLLRDSGLL